MFGVNHIVLYGNATICRIVELRSMAFKRGEEKEEYYVLKPVYEDRDTFFVPVSKAEERLEKLLSTEDIADLLKSTPDKSKIWADNASQRRKNYMDIINRGSHQELVDLIRILNEQQQTKLTQGKRLSQSDETMMIRAADKLYQVFRYLMEITPEEMIPYIVTGEKVKIA